MIFKQFKDDTLGPAPNRKTANHSYWILFVLFYAICSNIPYWTASHWLGLLPIGWFCVEYAIVGLLALYIPPILAAVLLVLVIAADLLNGVCKTYYLIPSVCLENFGAVSDFGGGRIVAGSLALILILLLASIAAFFPLEEIRGRHRLYAALSLLVFTIAILSADCATIVHESGHMPSPLRLKRPVDTNKFTSYENLWFSRYPFIRLLRDQGYFGLVRDAQSSSQFDTMPIPSAFSAAFPSIGAIGPIGTAAGKDGQPNIVLILLESWGLSADASMRSALVAPYAQPELLARYQVLQGTAPFNGTTVAGETRELCNSRMGFAIAHASAAKLQSCLPDRLAALGYHSISAHGMDGRVFERSLWYKNIGFQESLFRDQFRQQGLPDCVGAFKGTCDAAIAAWIGSRLSSKNVSPDLVYWVTLNSHLPAPIPSGLPDGASCALTQTLAQNADLCSWYQLVANVHTSVTRLAMSNLARPTIFVIVGDHAPPFVNPNLRSQFSPTDVPYVVLLPRQK
jgi:phosphoglycerol transferase MdoB-like AlkP superfamily enzyme